MALVGLFLGLKGQDTVSDVPITLLITVWTASIGYGFGTIFSQKRPSRRLPIHWAATGALVAPFFGLLLWVAMHPFSTTIQLTVAAVISALIGAPIGLAIGFLQLRIVLAKSRTTS